MSVEPIFIFVCGGGARGIGSPLSLLRLPEALLTAANCCTPPRDLLGKAGFGERWGGAFGFVGGEM